MLKFTAFGHKNITSRHKISFEFTKDEEVSLKGDCIVGVKADFSLSEIKKFIKNKKDKKLKIIIKVDNLKEEVNAELNPDFNDEKEIVVRKSNFISLRTLTIYADKAAADFSKEFKEKLRKEDSKLIVELS